MDDEKLFFSIRFAGSDYCSCGSSHIPRHTMKQSGSSQLFICMYDLIAANRKLLQDIQFRVKKMELGESENEK